MEIQAEDYTTEDHKAARAYLARLEQLAWDRTCRRDLTAFSIEALKPYGQTPARHHKILIDALERVSRGECKRLMVCMPPGHAKSTYSSVIFPAWFYAQRDNLDIIGASHVSDLAEDFSYKIHGLIRENSELLGYGLLSENVKRWRTSNGGFYRAVGVGGSITGRRADLGIIDDPVKGHEDAESPDQREKVWRWYQSDFYTRLKPDAAIIVIMTRWHEDDLGGRLLQAAADGGDQWEVINLPAICDSVNDPLGRPIGAALWPEWLDEIALLGGERIGTDGAKIPVPGIRKNVGEYVWGSLFQQDPKPRGSSFFDIVDLLVPLSGEKDALGNQIAVPVATPDRCDTVFAVIDTAIKAGAQHNSTAVTWYSYNALTKETPTLILDWDIVQVEGARQEAWLPSVHERGEELARQCGARRGYSGAIIEDKATGTVLIQQSINESRRAGKRPLAHAIDSKLTSMGKEERAIAAATYVVAGNVKITDAAYHKTKVHKGRSANHLITQVTDFRLGSKQKDGLDLLDTFCYGVLLTCGTNAGERKGI